MTLLDAPRKQSAACAGTRPRPLRAEPGSRAERGSPVLPDSRPAAGPPAPPGTVDDAAVDVAGVVQVGGTRIDPSGDMSYRGMRIRRVRLKSVAKLASVFWLLAGAILTGTVVVVWNVARSLGFVESFEETITTSLGLETFSIDGGGVFTVVAGGIGALCALGWVTTIALAAVYNAACGVLGGLAVETGPLQRRRRVFSWRHRRFVTVSE